MEDAGCESQYFIGDGDTPYTVCVLFSSVLPSRRFYWQGTLRQVLCLF
jgi:hypothetical protein